MSALAIHPSPRTGTTGAHRSRTAVCGHRRADPTAVHHLSVVPPAVDIAPLVPEPPVLASPAGSIRRGEPRLRLTARGRRVLIALGFALSIAIGGTMGTLAHSGSVMPHEVTTVVVQPGQSLWVIASASAAPGQDVREVVDQIRTMNGLDHSTVYAGQQLQVPLG